jgi:hypothetical protein
MMFAHRSRLLLCSMLMWATTALAAEHTAPPRAGTTPEIDAILERTWRARDNLQPSKRASDLTFLRRATLDIVGRIPTLAEITEFEKDEHPDKRARLIDRLLDSDEYSDYWATVWTDWLLPVRPPVFTVSGAARGPQCTGEVSVGRSSNPPLLHREQLMVWLEGQLERKDRGFDRIAIDLLSMEARGDEKGAVNLVALNVGLPTRDHFVPEHILAQHGQFDMVPITHHAMRLFLGIRFDGLPAQDISLNGEWTAEQFWGVNSFFRQIRLRGSTPRFARGNAVFIDLYDDPKTNPTGIVEFVKQNGEKHTTGPVFLDGRQFAQGRKWTRRQALALYIVGHPNFARAHVNRMWGHFFGRGLHERPEVDDLSKNHKLLHPELLDRLSDEFVRSGYNSRALIRAICNSRPYHASCVPIEPERLADCDRYFAHMPLKQMSAEQVYRSLRVVMDVGPRKPPREEPEWVKIRDEIDAAMVTGTGFGGQLDMALWLMNSEELDGMIAERVKQLVDRTERENKKFTRLFQQRLVDRTEQQNARLGDLFLATLTRRPTREEIRKIREDTRWILLTDRNELAQTEDILWALLQSSEFILNH